MQKQRISKRGFHLVPIAHAIVYLCDMYTSKFGTPNGNRTRTHTLKGWLPIPLVYGSIKNWRLWRESNSPHSVDSGTASTRCLQSLIYLVHMKRIELLSIGYQPIALTVELHVYFILAPVVGIEPTSFSVNSRTLSPWVLNRNYTTKKPSYCV